MPDAKFSLQEALAGQLALRHALHLPPEQFAMDAFVGMVSDEIEKLRAAGKTDADIASLYWRAQLASRSAPRN